jgi:hypothetical protein
MFRSGGGDHPAALGVLEPTDLEALASVNCGKPADGGPLAADDLPPQAWRDFSGLLRRSLVQVLFEASQYATSEHGSHWHQR